MEHSATDFVQETRFNAGVDIALDISRLFKQAEIYATSGDYVMWHLKLEAIERKMSPKFRIKKESNEEINDIRKKGTPPFKKYVLKYERNKKISRNLNDEIKLYLVTYERSLHYWRDKFGYGMPLKDDSRFVLG